MSDRQSGTVKRFNDASGFGFIARDNGPVVFVHFRAIASSGFKRLQEGRQVCCAMVQGQQGLQADDVSAARSAPLAQGKPRSDTGFFLPG